jgi:hypothetical protein
MLRGLIAIAVGLLLVEALTAYGGIGVNLLFFFDSLGMPQQESLWYNIVGIYSITMTILLACLAFLLLTEFTEWKLKFSRELLLVVAPSLCVLALMHVSAYMNIVKIQGPEIIEQFINGFIYYALSTLGAILLLSVIRWIGRQQKGQTNGPR